jgi:hypothetical protein
VYRVSCCPQGDQILPKLPAPRERFRRPGVYVGLLCRMSAVHTELHFNVKKTHWTGCCDTPLVALRGVCVCVCVQNVSVHSRICCPWKLHGSLRHFSFSGWKYCVSVVHVRIGGGQCVVWILHVRSSGGHCVLCHYFMFRSVGSVCRVCYMSRSVATSASCIIIPSQDQWGSMRCVSVTCQDRRIILKWISREVWWGHGLDRCGSG